MVISYHRVVGKKMTRRSLLARSFESLFVEGDSEQKLKKKCSL